MLPDVPHILLVDDDRDLSGITREYLQEKGFHVSLAHSADEGMSAFQDGKVDVCVLDVKMPFRDGFSLAEEIRSLDADVPIIFLTGQRETEHRIKGLSIGADDYVTKPFSMQELYLRLNVVLRRTRRQTEEATDTFDIGRYHYDRTSRILQIGNQKARLSSMEGHLLTLFCTQPEGRVTRDQALREVWQDEDHLKARSLNVYITKLRNRLKDDPHVEILNVHGTGYQLVVRSS
ncbi:MAG: response regulator transcription factor [Saprospiraceae bacterium]|nr:response regulator transcription factor [Saprospiraceae bacterium]